MVYENIFKERRTHPRKKTCIPIGFEFNDVPCSAHTINMSGTGTFCETNTYRMPVQTKLKVFLMLPRSSEVINCYGIIVRAEDSHSDIFGTRTNRIAIHFDGIHKSEVEKIVSHLENIQ
ncbi:MAG: PilZ domain-containing protein [Candidatus Brocadiaceae bacterium]|nr:PilZ domain-containing protein [Candidatus Brocadiaceae bacterium]